MPTFNDLDELLNHLQTDVVDSLETDVADDIKELESEKVQTEVFDKYNPFSYQRRVKGGLNDITNMVEHVDVVGDNIILTVDNVTKGSDQTDMYIAPLVEYGDNNGYGEYMYKFNRERTAYLFLQPRPFIEETAKSLDEDGLLNEYLKRSLKSKGYDMK